MSALLVGYAHFHLIPSVADLQFATWVAGGQLISTICTFLLQPSLMPLKPLDHTTWQCAMSTLCQDDHFDDGWTAVFLIKWSHCCVTFVRPFTWLCSNLTKVTFTDNSYSLTKLVSALNCHLTSVILAILECTLAFPVRVSVIYL